MVGDYCFLKTTTDSGHLPVLVIRIYPFKLFFAMVVPAKGSHPDVVARLAHFIKEVGLLHFCYRSDKEPAIRSMIQDACAMAGRTSQLVKSDEPIPLPDVIEHEDILEAELPPAKGLESKPALLAVPEHSHPGESASNGLSERAIQTFEDQFRTFKVALESNIGHKLAWDHPVLPWLVEHTTYIMNKHAWH